MGGFMAIYAIKKVGPAVGNYLDQEVEKEDSALNASRSSSIQAAADTIEAEKLEQERAKAQVMIFDAKHENVALQLEAAYRENLVMVHQEVKKRLDYQVEIQNVQRNMEQKHGRLCHSQCRSRHHPCARESRSEPVHSQHQ